MMAYGSDAVVDYALEHIPVDRDHATPLALLLSELVTNACKYAFPDGGGSISIGLREGRNGRAELTVRDSGGGIEAERDAGGSMGMRLIKGVVAQMDGTHRFRNDGGTVFEADIALSTRVRNVG
jgi:two-component sensor histidine kinase